MQTFIGKDYFGFPDSSDGKESAFNAGNPGQSLGWEDPRRREWLSIPVLLPGEFHGQRSLEGYSPWGHKKSDTTEKLTLSLCYQYSTGAKTSSQNRRECTKCGWGINTGIQFICKFYNVLPWSCWASMKYYKLEAGQRLIEFCKDSALVTANTLFQQHKRRLYTWTSPDGQYRNQIDYTLCSQR